MKKIGLFILFCFSFLIVACSKKEGPHSIRVGVMAGPEAELMEVAKNVAKQKYNLDVHIVTFTDYALPNQALADGSIDMNAFQHVPFLLQQIKAHHYNLVVVGDMFLYPMGLYSKKITGLSEFKPGDKIAIPNDPSNESRALLLLEKAGLIDLKPNATINATPEDIQGNPKHLEIIPLDAAQLPRSLSDVTAAAINTTFAIPAGLSLKDALFKEPNDSPYVNVMVTQANDKESRKVKELVKSYQSEAVVDEATRLFHGAAIPGWKDEE